MRITAGEMKGRMLATPRDAAIRPSSDKVRQAIFNLLEHHPKLDDFALAKARVIDLFAGTGALGLEALSRGAGYCLFVDNSTAGRALIRQNIEDLGLTGRTKIWRRDAAQLGRLDTLAPFGLAFLDPPYRQQLIEPALMSLRDGGWLLPGAVVVAESDEDEAVVAPSGYEPIDRRIYGSTAVTLLRYC
jgi:16S rRNA (guanine966-N2)-methyltransferase